MVVAFLVVCGSGAGAAAVTGGKVGGHGGRFTPSNARTTDGQLIPEAQFFRAERCAGCHADAFRDWSESLHRNAGREPFYKESVDILLDTRGIEKTRHCEGCHAPISVISGALTKGSTASRAMDDEGVTCTVCHSIAEVRPDGTGSYTIRRPALLISADGTPVLGDVPDAAILANVDAHRRAVMNPVLRTPEFCGACHKSSVPPELNGYKPIRGFSAYDEWQQSGASHEAVGPFYLRSRRTPCIACHMHRVKSEADVAAKEGMIASHRWLGANTAAPLFYDQPTQAELTKSFLERGVLGVDVFAVRNEATGTFIAPLYAGPGVRVVAPAGWQAGQRVTVEVVVANRNAGHSFPPELRDLYEAWVEFDAVTEAGEIVFRSGAIESNGNLDPRAHVYRTILLDGAGRALERHEVWLAAVKAYDNAIPPGGSDVVRFSFPWRGDEKTGAPATLTLRARVNYRRFNNQYAAFVLERRKRQLAIPVVRMAEAMVAVAAPAADKAKEQDAALSSSAADDARRWNDYGIGLLNQAQYAPAAEAFRHASALQPHDPGPLVSAAIAEMKTERFGPERDQWRKAGQLIDRALQLAPALARALYWRAAWLRGEGQTREAATVLKALASRYPKDREVQRQLGQTLYSLGQRGPARRAFETLIAIDPTDADAHRFLAPLLATEGKTAEAERERSLHLGWRDDPKVDGIAARFFAAHPQWADERIPFHVHGAAASRDGLPAGHPPHRVDDLVLGSR